MVYPKHIDKQTADGTAQNLEALYKLFPSCFTESADVMGNVKRAINWGKLRELLGDNIADGEPEVYDFTWVGKRAAQREAMAPIRKTLRPCPEESVNWDTTQNLYIEGDNLEVLKLLQNSYMGKVKMIYIDPPYNTGNDLIYNDNRMMSEEQYNEAISDSEGNRLFKNTYSNGSFHSDWCSMIYERLIVSRPLLSDDGVFFLSIDDNELRNLKNICDEVLGEQNFISIIPRIAKKGSNQGTHFRPTKDYILCYAKNFESLKSFNDKNLIEEKKNYPYEENGRKYRKAHSLFQASLDPLRGCVNQRYYIEAPDGTLIIPPGDNFPISSFDGAQIAPVTKNDKVWRWSKDSYMAKKGIIMFDKSQRSPLVDSLGHHTDWNVYEKKYEDEESHIEVGALPNDVIYDYINSLGTTTLHELGLAVGGQVVGFSQQGLESLPKLGIDGLFTLVKVHEWSYLLHYSMYFSCLLLLAQRYEKIFILPRFSPSFYPQIFVPPKFAKEPLYFAEEPPYFPAEPLYFPEEPPHFCMRKLRYKAPL